MCIFGPLVQYLAVVLEVLSLFQSVAFVSGIQETKKTWIKLLRWSTYVITIIFTAFLLFYTTTWSIYSNTPLTNVIHNFYVRSDDRFELIYNFYPSLFTLWIAFVCTIVFKQLWTVVKKTTLQQQQKTKQRTKQMKLLTFVLVLGFILQSIYFGFRANLFLYNQ